LAEAGKSHEFAASEQTCEFAHSFGFTQDSWRKFSPPNHTMLLITVHLQIPEMGIDTHLDWQPMHLQHFMGDNDLVLAIEITIFPRIPVVHCTANFTYIAP